MSSPLVLPKRTMASIAKLQRIQATTLADLVLKRDPHLAIVDVRDDGEPLG